MSSQRQLVHELDISWGEANGYVTQAKADLGPDADDEAVYSYAKDMWGFQHDALPKSFSKNNNNDDDQVPPAVPIEDTENMTDEEGTTEAEDEQPIQEVPAGKMLGAKEDEEEEEDYDASNEEISQEAIGEDLTDEDDFEDAEEPEKSEETLSSDEEQDIQVDDNGFVTPPASPPRIIPTDMHSVSSAPKETLDPATPGRKPMEPELSTKTTDSVQVPSPPRVSLRVAFYDLGSSNVDLVLDALNELNDMHLHSSKHKKKTKLVITQGAAPMGVLQAMRNHGVEHGDVACKCLALLLSLTATGEVECEKSLIELEGTSLILAMMKAHMENVNVQVHGLGLLCNLSAYGTKEAMRIVRDGAAAVIIQDMRRFDHLNYLQRRGCKCLANLAVTWPKCKETIREEKGVSAIGAAMESFPVGGSVYFEARRAMACFL